MNMELILLGSMVVSILMEALIYSAVTYFLLFRKEEVKPSFWKYFGIYLLLVILFNLLGFLVVFLLLKLKLMIVLYFLSSYPFMSIIVKTVFTLLFMSYFSARWIKYHDGENIGMKQGGKVVAIVTLLSFIFTFSLGFVNSITHSPKANIEASVKRQEAISPIKNYEHVMNMPLSKEVREFKHIKGIEYGLYTDLVFHYYAPQSYFENLKNNTNFIQEIWLNSVFQEVKCYKNKPEMVCYKGTIYPYVHDITYNPKTEEVNHVVTGISD